MVWSRIPGLSTTFLTASLIALYDLLVQLKVHLYLREYITRIQTERVPGIPSQFTGQILDLLCFTPLNFSSSLVPFTQLFL